MAEVKGEFKENVEIVNRLNKELLDTKSMFLANYGSPISLDPQSQKVKLAIKIGDEYAIVQQLERQKAALKPSAGAAGVSAVIEDEPEVKDKTKIAETKTSVSDLVREAAAAPAKASTALVAVAPGPEKTRISSLMNIRRTPKPEWHAPWKLSKVLPGHIGWVHCVAVEPANEWFATGSADRTIKFWDLASGTLKLTLTGHINSVMDLAVSQRSPYLFSCGLDKKVFCWDLEQNKIIRHYHGHLSGVFCLAMHPTLDILFTGGRDGTVRVWDIRTKAEIRVLGGHTHTVASLVTQATEPQVISGSHDQTVRLWDIVAGKASAVLTNHKKSIRAMAMHPVEYSFATGAADNIKIWKCPDGVFLRNLSGHNAIVNSMAINRDNVLVSAADNGSIHMWDWKTGYNFQQIQTIPQPGSLDSEAGVYQVKFDQTGSRMLTVEADKTVKIWKEDETATPETHPVDFKPPRRRKRF